MAMSPRLLRPRATSAYDADAQVYFNAVAIADGQQLEPAVKKAISDFVKGCKADGIWSAIKASCILMGARTLSGALTPLVGAAPTNINFVSGDYNRKTGLVGNGTTKYINTNRAANADPQNNFHASIYGSSLQGGSGSSSPVWLSVYSASPSIVRSVQLLYFSFSGLGYFFNARVGSTPSTWDTPLVPSGFVGVSRTGSNASTGRAKGTDRSFTSASAAATQRDISVFASNEDAGVVNYTNSRLAFYSVGESLTLSLLDSRVTTLYNAIGAAIP